LPEGVFYFSGPANAKRPGLRQSPAAFTSSKHGVLAFSFRCGFPHLKAPADWRTPKPGSKFRPGPASAKRPGLRQSPAAFASVKLVCWCFSCSFAVNVRIIQSASGLAHSKTWQQISARLRPARSVLDCGSLLPLLQ
jgi:hypothetical protein